MRTSRVSHTELLPLAGYMTEVRKNLTQFKDTPTITWMKDQLDLLSEMRAVCMAKFDDMVPKLGAEEAFRFVTRFRRSVAESFIGTIENVHKDGMRMQMAIDNYAQYLMACIQCMRNQSLCLAEETDDFDEDDVQVQRGVHDFKDAVAMDDSDNDDQEAYRVARRGRPDYGASRVATRASQPLPCSGDGDGDWEAVSTGQFDERDARVRVTKRARRDGLAAPLPTTQATDNSDGYAAGAAAVAASMGVAPEGASLASTDHDNNDDDDDQGAKRKINERTKTKSASVASVASTAPIDAAVSPASTPEPKLTSVRPPRWTIKAALLTDSV